MFKRNSQAISRTIVLLAPSTSQPRIIKRASQLNKIAPVRILAFARKYYNINSFDADIPINVVASIEDRQYILRTWKIFKFFRKLLQLPRSNTITYACSLDLLILGYLSGRKLDYYEIGDLRTCEAPKSIISRIERFLIRRTKKVIITSQAFFDDYFKLYGFQESKFLVLENKVNIQNFKLNKQVNSSNSGRIRIGLIGFLRYKTPIEMIIRFVKENSEHFELICYGDGPFKYLLESENDVCIKYKGIYSASKDLMKIYSQIDVNYVVYDSSSKNVQMAIPNKFYESILFKKPIIVSKNTQLSKIVKKYDVGISIYLDNDECLSSKLLSLNRLQLKRCVKNCENLDPSIYIDDSMSQLIKEFVHYIK
jgi:succinoglycan biosynthesis protein ExoL